MKALIVIALTVASIGCFAQAKPYDIKGDQLGMPLEAFQQKYFGVHERYAGYPKERKATGPFCTSREDSSLMLSAEEAAAGVVACFPGDLAMVTVHWAPSPTIANVPQMAYAIHFYKGQLFKVIAIFSADGYDAMKAAFTEKFGAPVITAHELQNAYGAKFDGEESNWSNGVSAIQMKRRVTDLSTGAMVMTLPEIEKQVEAATPKKPKDL